MTNHDLLAGFVDLLARSRTFQVWREDHYGASQAYTQSVGNFIYLADELGLYRMHFEELSALVLDCQNGTYNKYDLSNPDDMESIIKRFDIDENREPKAVDPVTIIPTLMGQNNVCT